MVAERAGERFVGAVIRVQRNNENIWRAGRKRPRRLGQTARPHITHDGKAGRGGKGANHVKARHAGHAGNFVQRQVAGQMAFDEPERFLGGIHQVTDSTRSGAIMREPWAPRLIVVALVKIGRYLPPSFAAPSLGASLAAPSFGGVSAFFL